MNNNIWKIARIIDEETGLLELGDKTYYGQVGMETAKSIADKLNDGLVLNTESEYFLVVMGHR